MKNNKDQKEMKNRDGEKKRTRTRRYNDRIYSKICTQENKFVMYDIHQSFCVILSCSFCDMMSLTMANVFINDV